MSEVYLKGWNATGGAISGSPTGGYATDFVQPKNKPFSLMIAAIAYSRRWRGTPLVSDRLGLTPNKISDATGIAGANASRQPL